MTEAVPVHFVAYEDDADLELNDDHDIENHDELVNSDQTYDEVRGMDPEQVEQFGLDVVEPSDGLWREKFADIEIGDAYRV